MPSARPISFGDNGNIESDELPKAVVRFPTEEELAEGMTVVPRHIRVREYQEKQHGK